MLGSCMAQWEWAVTESRLDSQSTIPSARRSVTRGFSGIDSQLIFEVGAHTSAKSEKEKGAVGIGTRYQRTIGRHHVLCLDSFVAGREREAVFYGLRTEQMVKF
ncbi:hypothetical protein V2P20_17775 [Methylobacter sp. Wu1]|uniref:hypothetical protein n=1 Tax=Methylobacter sp. Wu1 TaxID=3119359 RepID=UPI002F936C43